MANLSEQFSILIPRGSQCRHFRHRYRNVETNNFGLSTEEVLSAPDKELNAWCSLRKTCSYRPDEEERRDVAVFRGKGKNTELKRKVLPSLFKEDPEDALQEVLCYPDSVLQGYSCGWSETGLG